MSRFALVVASLVALVTVLTDFGVEPPARRRVAAAGYDRPIHDPHQSRSVTVAQYGIVATSQPLASEVGLDVLKRGGNAVDAAIAANAMLGLVEPMSCGIGGDLFVIYWDNKTQKLSGLNGSGRSPYKLTREVFKQKGLKDIPEQGPLCWSVPGCVAGWEDLRARFGTKPLAELLEPAISYAQDGFPVTEMISGIDLVREQILVAAGRPLAAHPGRRACSRGCDSSALGRSCPGGPSPVRRRCRG